MKINAKKELLEELGDRKILAADLCFWIDELEDEKIIYDSRKDSLEDFLSSLDHEYEESYGTQYLSGKVFLDDKSLLERAEYDGAEWWRQVRLPNTIDEFFGK